jgi:NAD-dependent deacetylase
LEELREGGELPPICRRCGAEMKSDVVHFGEPIPSDVVYQSLEVVHRSDVMLICGTSALVYPFAGLPRIARERTTPIVTIIEINAEPTPLTYQKISDYLIQGKTGEILPRIVSEIRKMRNQLS